MEVQQYYYGKLFSSLKRTQTCARVLPFQVEFCPVFLFIIFV